MIHSSTSEIDLHASETMEQVSSKMRYALAMAWVRLADKVAVGTYYIARITDETHTNTHNGLFIKTEYIVRVDLREKP